VSYTKSGWEVFVEDLMVQDAVIRNLEVIGEAASELSTEFRQSNPDVQWRRAISLRNMLIHNYMGAFARRVWSDVTLTLPTLKQQISAILVEEAAEPNPDSEEPRT
jgi:uncharacterized protein with HEPN domain